MSHILTTITSTLCGMQAILINSIYTVATIVLIWLPAHGSAKRPREVREWLRSMYTQKQVARMTSKGTLR